MKVQVRLKVRRHLLKVAVRRQKRIQLRILQSLVCLLLPKGHQEPVIHQSQMIRQQNSTQSSSEPKTSNTGSSVSQLPPSNQPIADSSQTVDLSDKLVTPPTILI